MSAAGFFRGRGAVQFIDTDRLAAAFKAMRAAGFIARQRFSCCGGCAGAAIATDVAKMPAMKRIAVKGAVFFHRQDAAALTDGGEMFVSFGPVSCSGVGTYGLETAEVGRAAASLLRAAGLRVEWDGNPSTRILVKPVRLDARGLLRRAEGLDQAQSRRANVADVGRRRWTYTNSTRRADLMRSFARLNAMGVRL